MRASQQEGRHPMPALKLTVCWHIAVASLETGKMISTAGSSAKIREKTFVSSLEKSKQKIFTAWNQISICFVFFFCTEGRSVKCPIYPECDNYTDKKSTDQDTKHQLWFLSLEKNKQTKTQPSKKNLKKDEIKNISYRQSCLFSWSPKEILSVSVVHSILK